MSIPEEGKSVGPGVLDKYGVTNARRALEGIIHREHIPTITYIYSTTYRRTLNIIPEAQWARDGN